MIGHKSFKELTRGGSGKRRPKAENRNNAMLAEIHEAEIAELRKALKVSEQELAALLGKSQGAVAQLEQRSDMKISTLRETIEALGGHLQLIAEFSAGQVRLSNLGQADDDKAGSPAA
ncbi:helix-turn-helix domain-containing protein [Chelativorans intermedius]|uniref:Helix-turn-helix domain-containing protein n=1 Tax=Chelativorans intermedius TaxID=515947 RepID=A0ABV6DCK5_9HYPH|nr:helix-turn-helix domain-containing protein [Chelativorans intermedius]MCT9000417.1 helix-turn-helix domain-containing protein [Chelativorans intermedius]